MNYGCSSLQSSISMQSLLSVSVNIISTVLVCSMFAKCKHKMVKNCTFFLLTKTIATVKKLLG